MIKLLGGAILFFVLLSIAFCPPPPTDTPTAEPEPIPEDVPVERTATMTATDDPGEPTAIATFPKPKHTAVSAALLLPETGVDQAGQRLRIWPLVVIGLLVVAAVAVVQRRVR